MDQSIPLVLHPPFSPREQEILREALQKGWLMSYPTETAYALGGNALHGELVEMIYRAKGRSGKKPLPLLVDGARSLEGLVGKPTRSARLLMKHCWPGALTLVLEAGSELPKHLVSGNGTIALRWSKHPVPNLLLKLGARALVGTSANLSGQTAATTWEQVWADFQHTLRVGIAGGTTGQGTPSTLVDCTQEPPRLLRAGAIAEDVLAQVLEKPLGNPPTAVY